MSHAQENSLLDPQLSKGISVDVPTGSTIYDPAILSLREDFKAKVEQRKAKQLQQSPGDDLLVQSPMHVSIASPLPRKSRKSRKSFFLRGDNEAAASESEDLELGDVDGETELCCNGYIPLYPLLIFMNSVKILAGIAGIAIGVFQLTTGGETSIGVSSLQRLVISGSFLFAIAFITIGVLLIVSGLLGIILFTIRLRSTNSFTAKRLDVVYHSGLFLLAIVLFVLFVLTVWVWVQSTEGGIYSNELWQELVRTNPLHLCKTEERLDCAAFELRQCKESANQTQMLFCPGHFCIDFCRITTEDVNVQPICAACRDESLRTIDSFVSCRRHETQFTNIAACMNTANADLLFAYRRLVAAALVSFLWIMASVCVSTYRYCFS